MKIRYLIIAILTYIAYSIMVYPNILGRMLNGYSIFSSDPSLNWLGSWQAFGVLLIGSFGLLAWVIYLFGWESAKAIDNMKPKQKKKALSFLKFCFTVLWRSRKHLPDKMSSAVKVAGTAFPDLTKS